MYYLYHCADLDQAEAFLQLQSSTCTTLFALSVGEYAVAADLARFVASQQQSTTTGSSGGGGNAGVWMMRGLAFCGIGAAHKTYLLVP